MLTGFDPERYEMDRRIFYEVTGRQLREGEFSYTINGEDEEQNDDSGDERLNTGP